MIPPFDADGNLPRGIHWATWDELVTRFGKESHRRTLTLGLWDAIQLLQAAGCEPIHVDGSFVTAKTLPRDIDVVWDAPSTDLSALDPIFLVRGAQRTQQRARFGCEFFSSMIAEASTGTPFVEYFQLTHDGRGKGIVALDLRRLP